FKVMQTAILENPFFDTVVRYNGEVDNSIRNKHTFVFYHLQLAILKNPNMGIQKPVAWSNVLVEICTIWSDTLKKLHTKETEDTKAILFDSWYSFLINVQEYKGKKNYTFVDHFNKYLIILKDFTNVF